MAKPSVEAAPPEGVPGIAVVNGATPSLTVNPAEVVTPEPGTVKVYSLRSGNGETIEGPGDTVVAQYVGYGGTSGQMFDSSYVRPEPAVFPLNQVIKGWTRGLLGAKVGERRLLVIPGDMAYGAVNNPPTGIAPNETLIFLVDVVDVNPAAPSVPAP